MLSVILALWCCEAYNTYITIFNKFRESNIIGYGHLEKSKK